jgi:hypothetical protein
VLIGCRVFHFQGDSLVEGEPCPTVEFKGSEMRGWRPEDDINESWAATCEEPLADMKKRARTANVHRYVAERRESRERWKKEGE